MRQLSIILAADSCRPFCSENLRSTHSLFQINDYFVAGLDTAADFDEYTVYMDVDGPANKECNKQAVGAVGLDATADFDDYTIYDEGEVLFPVGKMG